MGKGIVVGALALAAAAAIASPWLPGSDAWALGPRVGMVAFLAMLALLLLGVPAVQWVLRRTTRAEDYAGGCPVGARCACGASLTWA